MVPFWYSFREPRQALIFLCWSSLVVSTLHSFLVDSGYHLFSISGAKFSDEHINRMEEYIRLRRAAQPIKLIRLVRASPPNISFDKFLIVVVVV